MSGQDETFPMLDLYQQEVETHGRALSDGLLALEKGSSDKQVLDSLMRAAHSIKGAARIVGLKPVGDVAHVLEDAFVLAGKGDYEPNAEDLDTLLGAVDFIMASGQQDASTMGDWLSRAGEQAPALIEALKSPGKAAPVPAPPPEPKVEQAPPLEQAPPAMPEPVDGAAPEAVAKAAPAPARHTAKGDNVVRVSADNLNRLMGLTAETVVETRRLETFRETLFKLKEIQNDLNLQLECSHRLQEIASQDPAAAVELHLVRQSVRAGLDSIRKQIDTFDTFARSHTLLSDRLYREVLDSRMRPFADGVVGYPRLVRDIARSLGKQVKFDIEGKDTPVDRDILEKLDAPLNHILRNACDHGLEAPAEREASGKSATGHLRLSARHSAGMLVVEVRDDGRGISIGRVREKIRERSLCKAEMIDDMKKEELLEFLFLPGFSTASSVTDISGRGVGLDVVQTMMQQIGGYVRVQTEEGEGSTFVIEVPITRSVLRALIVEIDGEPYAFPLNRIVRTLLLTQDDLSTVENRQYFEMDGANVGLVSSHAALGLTGHASSVSRELIVVVLNDRNNLYGVEIDKLVGESDLVVRPLDMRLGKVPGISAASLTEEGEPLLIVDVEDLVQSIDKLLSGGSLLQAGRVEEGSGSRKRRRILVVDDSITVRETERQLLESAGYAVDVAVDGADGWNAVRLGEYDLVVSDVDMPRLNGFEFVKKIRGDKRLERLPVVIVSYKDREEDRLRGMEAGADYYLTKSSFQDDTFIKAVGDLLGG